MRNIFCNENKECRLDEPNMEPQAIQTGGGGGLAPEDEDYVIPLKSGVAKRIRRRQIGKGKAKATPARQIGQGKGKAKQKGKGKVVQRGKGRRRNKGRGKGKKSISRRATVTRKRRIFKSRKTKKQPWN